MHSTIIIVITVFICTFSYCISKLLFSYLFGYSVSVADYWDCTARSCVNVVSMLLSVVLSSRGQSGLVAKILASASKLWAQPRGFGLGLASISLSYYVIGHFSCKNRVKFGNFCLFFRQ